MDWQIGDGVVRRCWGKKIFPRVVEMKLLIFIDIPPQSKTGLLSL